MSKFRDELKRYTHYRNDDEFIEDVINKLRIGANNAIDKHVINPKKPEEVASLLTIPQHFIDNEKIDPPKVSASAGAIDKLNLEVKAERKTFKLVIFINPQSQTINSIVIS